ncbi:hypothetical protein HID58_075293, partial [Brassica napus]
FIVSVVYGSNCAIERRQLWLELEATANNPTIASSPWLILGDFNEIIATSEHTNEANIATTRGMREFRECLLRYIIRGCWHAFNFAGSHQLSISKKLKELKPIIRSFAKENYSNLEKRVVEAFDTLTLCQQFTLSSPSPSAAIAEEEAHRKWLELAQAEDSFLRQRSRIQW